MKVSVSDSSPVSPSWPVGTVALVRKAHQSDAVQPFLRFHAADYDRQTDAPSGASRIINLATGSVRYENVTDYTVLKVYDTLTIG